MDKPFVRVAWHDAEDYRESNWASEEELQGFAASACEAISFGYVVKKNRGYITLAADYIAPDTFGRVMKIPRKMIVSIQTVPLPEPQPTPAAAPSTAPADNPTH